MGLDLGLVKKVKEEIGYGQYVSAEGEHDWDCTRFTIRKRIADYPGMVYPEIDVYNQENVGRPDNIDNFVKWIGGLDIIKEDREFLLKVAFTLAKDDKLYLEWSW